MSLNDHVILRTNVNEMKQSIGWPFQRGFRRHTRRVSRCVGASVKAA